MFLTFSLFRKFCFYFLLLQNPSVLLSKSYIRRPVLQRGARLHEKTIELHWYMGPCPQGAITVQCICVLLFKMVTIATAKWCSETYVFLCSKWTSSAPRLSESAIFVKATPEGRRNATPTPKTVYRGTATMTRTFINARNTKCTPRLSERAIVGTSDSKEVLAGPPMKKKQLRSSHGHSQMTKL